MPSAKHYHVNYPFPINVFGPPGMMEAFTRSSLSEAQLAGLLHGFVMGATVEELKIPSFAPRESIPMSTKGEWHGAQNADGAEPQPISEATIRARFKDWKQLLFKDEFNAKYYLNDLCAFSETAPHDGHLFNQTYSFIEKWGLFDGLAPEKLEARLDFWEHIRQCIQGCGPGLNTKKFIGKSNGYTRYQWALTRWCQLLGNEDGNTSVDDYYMEHANACEASHIYLTDQVEKKKTCRSCHFKGVKDFDGYILESVIAILSDRRSKSLDDFYLNFMHAITTAIIWRETTLIVKGQVKGHSQWVIVPDSYRQRWYRNLYDMDRHFQTMVTRGVFAIVYLIKR